MTPNRLPTVTLVGYTINSSIQCVAIRGLWSDLDADRASDPTPNDSLGSAARDFRLRQAAVDVGLRDSDQTSEIAGLDLRGSISRLPWLVQAYLALIYAQSDLSWRAVQIMVRRQAKKPSNCSWASPSYYGVLEECHNAPAHVPFLNDACKVLDDVGEAAFCEHLAP